MQREPTEEERFARMTLDELNNSNRSKTCTSTTTRPTFAIARGRACRRTREWLKRWTSTRMTIEGHADSRGTNEYNLALGERRANAVRDYLVTLGVPVARISIVSKGEEEPIVP